MKFIYKNSIISRNLTLIISVILLSLFAAFFINYVILQNQMLTRVDLVTKNVEARAILGKMSCRMAAKNINAMNAINGIKNVAYTCVQYDGTDDSVEQIAKARINELTKQK